MERPTREGRQCKWCGCTTRFVHSHKCIHYSRTDHLSASSLEKRRSTWRAHYHRHADQIAEKKQSLDYKEKFSRWFAAYYPANRWQYTARRAERRSLQRRATPSWSDLVAIRDIYASCPEGHHVDHIVPIAGRNVCGLHVPHNLQILPARENLIKSNHYG